MRFINVHLPVFKMAASFAIICSVAATTLKTINLVRNQFFRYNILKYEKKIFKSTGSLKIILSLQIDNLFRNNPTSLVQSSKEILSKYGNTSTFFLAIKRIDNLRGRT